MMADMIHALFCNPPIVIARLGSSTAPLVAYSWATHANPHNDADTGIVPEWSLEVMSDGSLMPFKPQEIRFRDGNAIRPVCPFVELWARVGEPGSDPAAWRDQPVTEALLAQFGASLSALSFRVEARNAKVARRTQNADLVYGLFPAVSIRGDQHDRLPLIATSPPSAQRAMIPAGRGIPLGSLQVCKPTANSSSQSGNPSSPINLEVVRFRFTPATGAFYGPPQAATATNESPVPAVLAANAFLNAAAGWFQSGGQGGGFVEPSDTFDTVSRGGNAPSLGVIDDTCDARVEISLQMPGQGSAPASALATILVGPPDFAPDRRPFVSIADDLNDRSAASADRSAAMSDQDVEVWVQDLFQRAYEAVSLMNVDFWRSERGAQLSGRQLAVQPIPNDEVAPPDQALGSQDALRERLVSISAPNEDQPLPISERARERHRSLADLDQLKGLLARRPERLRQLVRPPFWVEEGEGLGTSTMRMPPFMRASNANPLTLTGWQYDLLMQWAGTTTAAGAVLVAAAEAPGAPVAARLSEHAASRQREVLARKPERSIA